jgi:isoamylase
MLLMGDEIRRTQRGNNNAYARDDEMSWLDWSLLERHSDLHRFVRELIRLRRRHRSLRRPRFLTGQPGSGRDGLPDIRWQDADGGPPDWSDPQSRWLSFTLSSREAGEPVLLALLNMGSGPRRALLPVLAGCNWRRTLDTSLPPPRDIAPPEQQEPLAGPDYLVPARSVVVLEAWRD